MLFTTESLIGILLSLYACGKVSDYIIAQSEVSQWKTNSKDWWMRLENIPWNKILNDSNSLFLGLFDAIYGSKVFSVRRIVRSTFCSIFAICTISLVVGIEQTVLFKLFKGQGLLITVLVIFCLNPIIDYFSLIETRWILKKAKETHWSIIVLLSILDIVLTVLIFWIGIHFSLCFIGPLLKQGYEFISIRSILMEWSDFGDGGIFLFSTFFTSVLWYLFVLYVSCIKIAEKSSRRITVFLSYVDQSGKPGQMIAIVLSIPVILIYLLSMLIN